MTEKKVTVIELENGLMLNIEDISREISADAFVVKALLYIDFTFTQDDAESMDMTVESLVDILGSTEIRFEKILERNFIKSVEKESVLKDMIASYLGTNQRYFSRADFKTGVIRRKIIEKRGRYYSESI